MHDSVMVWTRRIVDENGLTAKAPVLDVGSRYVNGTTRDLFTTDDWTGLDMIDGTNVTVLSSSHEMPFDDEHFDLVVSTEMLEHDPHPDLTLAEMNRVLAAHGDLILTARGPGFGLHDWPGDHWRFTVQTMYEGLMSAGFMVLSLIDDPEFPGVFAHARAVSTPDARDLAEWVGTLYAMKDEQR
jgi:SAM-dependent methyltransferase